MARRRSKRRSKRRRRANFLRLLAVMPPLVAMIYILLPYCCVREEVTIEAGESFPGVGAFLRWENKNASLISEIEENIVFHHVEDHNVIVRIYGRDMPGILHVRDTAAPDVVTRDVTLYGGGSVKIEDFLVEIRDETPYSVGFVRKPDSVREGVSTVLLEVQDEGGNVTTARARLEVIYDTEPPVISGVSELTMTAGGSISYKRGVTVTDDHDQDVTLTIDVSAVDTDRAGDYTVTYVAVDKAGNETSVSTILHVKPLTLDTVTEEIINSEADKLLATILTDSMSQYDQAKAIFDWCHNKIAYSEGTPKTNWVQGAYRGIIDRRGDCYVYAATAKCLLTRVGIKNMDIEKIPSDSRHYWNLIDIGDGWYHFDTCMRSDGATFFYKTDAELMKYSNTHNRSHNYDKSLYPEIK